MMYSERHHSKFAAYAGMGVVLFIVGFVALVVKIVCWLL